MPSTRSGKETFQESDNKSNKKAKEIANQRRTCDTSLNPGDNDMSISLENPRLKRRQKRDEKVAESGDNKAEKKENESSEKVPEEVTDTPVSWITPSRMIILIVFIAVLLIIVLFFLPRNPGVPGKPEKKLVEFERCIHNLSSIFPKQEDKLWERIVKNYNHNSEHKRTVMCQTLITHASNLKTVECLVKKFANCLGGSLDSLPFTFTPSEDFDVSASELERHLYSSFPKSVWYFESISDYSFPLPFVFQSICDPDHSPHKNKSFYFSILTEQQITETVTYKRMSKLIEDILTESWVRGDGKSLSEEEAVPIITRIAGISYYIHQEDDKVTCE